MELNKTIESNILNEGTPRTASPPPPNDTTNDFIEVNNTTESENRIQSLFDTTNPTDSSLDDDSSQVGNDQVTTTSNDVNKDQLVDSITASTLVITKSQFLNDDLNESVTNFEENKNELSSSSEDENKSDSIEQNEEENRANQNSIIEIESKQNNEINNLKNQLEKEDFNLGFKFFIFLIFNLKNT